MCFKMLKYLIITLTLCVMLQSQVGDASPSSSQLSFELNGRIINGTVASFNATKHQVSIRRRRNDGYFFGTGHICGGSLISSDVVLSAAHCFVNYDINNGTFRPDEDFTVVMGNLDRFERNNYTLVFDVQKIVYNVSHFNLSTYERDIALVFLNDSVPANYTRAQIIKLNTQQVPHDTVCQATGWGETEEGYLSDILLTVDVPIINETVCASETNYHPSLIREGMLCAGYPQGGRDACAGDSGGPLVCNNKLAGIVSWGKSCAVPLQPGVYTNVSYWSQWIEEHSGVKGAASISHVSAFLTLLTLALLALLD
uniref:Trypsin eta n=1 Tax=Zeugodacus cucurbitae TaxID=28588 RepID=A0A0A1XPK1_ZEUCU